MLSFIVWLVGVACAVWCVLDILKKPVSNVSKAVIAVAVLVTSWLGFAVYYLWLRDNVTKYFN